MADIPAAWANNPQGYAIYLAESAKASQLAQQSNTQVQQAQQQFQAVQSGQRQLSSSTLQQIQSQPASAPSTRYQQIQQQYQQQHLASVGTSGTMYPDSQGQMVYVSGASRGEVFRPKAAEQPLVAKQSRADQAKQQVFANYLGHIEAGRAAGNIAPVEKPPQGIVGNVLTAASKITSLGQTGYQAIVSRGVAGAAKVLNQPQERMVPVAEPFKVSIQKSGVKLPYFGEVGIPAVEGNPFYGMSKQRRALPGVETLAVFLEPKEKASTARFREEYNKQQAQQQQAAREQATIVGEAQKKGWFNAGANQIETPDTSEGRAFAERVNKAGLQTMKANAASAGLFAAGEKYNIVQKVQTPQGETYQFNPANRTTDYEYLMGRANVAGAAGIKAGVPGLSENLALVRRVAEAQATLAPTNPAMLAGAFGAGAAEEVVRKPATAAQNVALGAIFGGVTKGVGLAGEAAGITKGAAGVRGVAARWIPRVAGGAMVGMYGADIGMRVSAEPTIGAKMGRIGAIGSTEVAPMAIGFSGGYKAVEEAAPKVRAGYDLIKGSVNRVHEANVLGTAKVKTIEAFEKVKTGGGRFNAESGMLFPPDEPAPKLYPEEKRWIEQMRKQKDAVYVDPNVFRGQEEITLFTTPDEKLLVKFPESAKGRSLVASGDRLSVYDNGLLYARRKLVSSHTHPVTDSWREMPSAEDLGVVQYGDEAAMRIVTKDTLTVVKNKILPPKVSPEYSQSEAFVRSAYRNSGLDLPITGGKGPLPPQEISNRIGGIYRERMRMGETDPRLAAREAIGDYVKDWGTIQYYRVTPEMEVKPLKFIVERPIQGKAPSFGSRVKSRILGAVEKIKTGGGRFDPESGMLLPEKPRKTGMPQEHIPTIDLTQEVDVRPVYDLAKGKPIELADQYLSPQERSFLIQRAKLTPLEIQVAKERSLSLNDILGMRESGEEIAQVTIVHGALRNKPAVRTQAVQRAPTIGVLWQSGDTVLLGKKLRVPQLQVQALKTTTAAYMQYYPQEAIVEQKPYVLTRLSKLSQRTAEGHAIGNFAALTSRFKTQQVNKNEQDLIIGNIGLQRSRSETLQMQSSGLLQAQQQVQQQIQQQKLLQRQLTQQGTLQRQAQRESTLEKTKMVQVHINRPYRETATRITNEPVPVINPVITPIPIPIPPPPPPPPPPYNPYGFKRTPTTAGPQPKPQFGAWNPEGGMGSYPRRHGLYAFEERLALITPGQMMTGMWGSKRKSARRKKIR